MIAGGVPARVPRWLALGAAGLALCLAAGCGSRGGERRNIVVISLDTLRADALGTYGEERPTSPELDRFAATATVFDEAFSQAGMTAPSHATLFTSLYPSVHRVNNLEGPGPNGQRPDHWRIDPDVQTLAELLRDAGWRTAAFHGGGQINRSIGFDQGFELFDGKYDNGMNASGVQTFDFSRAASWIERHADEPFFLFLHTYLPHAPYVPPEPWGRVFDRDYSGPIPDRAAYLAAMVSGDPGPPKPGPDASPLRRSMLQHAPWQFWGWVDPEDPREVEHLRALYAGNVRATDQAVSIMLQTLVRAGIDERTIVVVLSDHGEGFLEHGTFEHPGSIYQEIAHVPLVVRVPGAAPRRIGTPVGLIDVAPTLCELVGVRPPKAMQGHSFAGLLRGEAPPAGDRGGVWTEYVRRWREAPDGPEPEVSLETLRDERWTYLLRNRRGELTFELYDRLDDPSEQHDLAGEAENAGRLAEFRKRYEQHERDCAAARAGVAALPPHELSGEMVEQMRQLGYAR